jgi:primosomal protein N' (replication factor Y)
MYYLICPIGVIRGKEDLLTYSSDTELVVGQIVDIPFGRYEKKGVIWQATEKPTFTTKPISKIHDEVLPKQLVELAQWMSDYYAARLSLALQTVVPQGIGKKRRDKFTKLDIKNVNDTIHPLTTAQKDAIYQVEKSSKTTHLLHGVTGSGKTTIYKELAKKTLKANKSVIILVPEIGLTPQLSANFQSLTTNVLVLHSKLTEAQRHLAWNEINKSDEPWVVVGPRSALFTPLSKVGLIVVDECHEPSYTQDSQPKYSALRVARKLAGLHPNSKLILGSATPNIADYYIAEQTKAPIITISEPVQKYDRTVTIVDAKNRDLFTSHRLFSNKLLDAVEASLTSNDQVMLFHNRRATARIALCSNCGWSAECKNCHVPMRLHHDKHILKCHICGLTEPLPASCPDCKQPDIEFRGFGSKRVEQEIAKLFPQAKIARFDSDTPEKEQMQHRYNELVNNEIDIVIGTQGIAKGLDLPRLSTIGIISSDTELLVPDFSSAERAFQIISQVIGRAGRSGQKSNVFIQTMNTDHCVIKDAVTQNYNNFYKQEVENRQLGHLPPLTFLLQLQIGYKNVETAEKHAEELKVTIKNKHPKVSVRGPSPAFHSYRSGNHFIQLVVSSQSRAILVEIAKNLPNKWQFTLDPINLL